MVMVGVDAKSGRPVCLKVTGDRERHENELRLRRKLDAHSRGDFVVELFDHVEDKMGNLTMVLEYAELAARRAADGSVPDPTCRRITSGFGHRPPPPLFGIVHDLRPDHFYWVGGMRAGRPQPRPARGRGSPALARTADVHYVAPEVAMVMLARAQHQEAAIDAMADGAGRRTPSRWRTSRRRRSTRGLGLDVRALAGAPIFSTNRSPGRRTRALCDGSVHIGLGAVHPASARSFVRKRWRSSPTAARRRQMAKHAWLNGGLDAELGVLPRPPAEAGEQPQLARIEAEIKDVFAQGGGGRARQAVGEQHRRKRDAEATKAVGLAGAENSF